MTSGVRAVCLTRSAALRRTLRRTFHATGTDVEFADDLTGADPADAVIVVDRAACTGLGEAGVARIADSRGLIVIGGSIEDDEVLTALRRARWNHAILEPEEPEDTELVVTTTKLRSGDLFGLEKYLAWGVSIDERTVTDYDGKRDAVEAVAASAREAGARRTTVARIENVTDELLMNALYDAPAAALGERATGATPWSTAPGKPVRLRWACDGRHFAVSVEDGYGALTKADILDHRAAARARRGAPRTGSDGRAGAGLGLYFVLAAVTRFVANLEAGQRTEVVCLFDLRLSGIASEACARSLHVFGA